MWWIHTTSLVVCDYLCHTLPLTTIRVWWESSYLCKITWNSLYLKSPNYIVHFSWVSWPHFPLPSIWSGTPFSRSAGCWHPAVLVLGSTGDLWEWHHIPHLPSAPHTHFLPFSPPPTTILIDTRDGLLFWEQFLVFLLLTKLANWIYF